MPVINRRTRGKRLVRHITRLDAENNETLYAYATFIDEKPEYVLNELINEVLAADEEYRVWRAAHAESFVPQPTGRRRRLYRRSAHRHATNPTSGPSNATTEMTVN